MTARRKEIMNFSGFVVGSVMLLTIAFTHALSSSNSNYSLLFTTKHTKNAKYRFSDK